MRPCSLQRAVRQAGTSSRQARDMGCRTVASHSASGKSPSAPHGHGRRAECLPPLQHHCGSLHLCARDLSAERLQAPKPSLQCPTSARTNSGCRASSSLQRGRGAPPAPMVAAVGQASARSTIPPSLPTIRDDKSA
jgi:hypothetical protein